MLGNSLTEREFISLAQRTPNLIYKHANLNLHIYLHTNFLLLGLMQHANVNTDRIKKWWSMIS